MNRITLAGNLPGGQPFAAVVARRVIVVEIDGRINAAHNRTMTREDAEELWRSLGVLLHSAHDHGESGFGADGGGPGDQGGPGRGPDQAGA